MRSEVGVYWEILLAILSTCPESEVRAVCEFLVVELGCGYAFSEGTTSL